MANSNVEFCGRVSDRELREMYASSRALLLPGEEDFGMTAVEALASGKPVIALGRGGALESVPTADPVGGVLYTEPIEEELAIAVEQFDRIEKHISAQSLQAWAQRFRKENFIQQMTPILFPPAGI